MERPEIFTAEHLKLFLDTNGTIQSQFSKQFVSSRPIAAILQVIADAFEPSCELLTLLRDLGLARVSIADLAAVRGRQNIVEPDVLEELRMNGVEGFGLGAVQAHYEGQDD